MAVKPIFPLAPFTHESPYQAILSPITYAHITHMQIMEGDLIRTIREQHRWFGHYHLAGNPGRHEPDATQEINYPPIYQAIASTGFTGYVGHEYVPMGDPVQALKHSFSLGKFPVG